MEVGGIDIRGSTSTKYAVDVRVRDEHSLMKAVMNNLSSLDIIYIVQIFPPLNSNSVFILPIQPFDDLPIGKNYSVRLEISLIYIYTSYWE